MKKIYPRVLIRKRDGTWWSYVVPFPNAPEVKWVELTFGMYRADVRNQTQRLLTGKPPRFSLTLEVEKLIASYTDGPTF